MATFFFSVAVVPKRHSAVQVRLVDGALAVAASHLQARLAVHWRPLAWVPSQLSL